MSSSVFIPAILVIGAFFILMLLKSKNWKK